MSLTSDADSSSDMNVDRIHCSSSSYSDLNTDDHIYSAFHLNSDMRGTHTLNSDSHITCFQMTGSLLTGFDCFDLTSDLIELTLQTLFTVRVQVKSVIAASCFLKSAVETDKLTDTDKNRS